MSAVAAVSAPARPEPVAVYRDDGPFARALGALIGSRIARVPPPLLIGARARCRCSRSPRSAAPTSRTASPPRCSPGCC